MVDYEAKRDLRESRLGVELCLFLRGNFSNSTKHVIKESLFMGKFGGKIARNTCLGGVFPGDRKSHLVYISKTSDHACVQH